MTGTEFEEYLAGFFRSRGFGVQGTPSSGDQGVDLILTRGSLRTAVQVKRYKAAVGNEAVQQVFAGKCFYRADEAWVVTTSDFTPKAVELANALTVRLIDGQELRRWLAGAGSPG